MILSASGWRKVFAASGDEQDKSPEITETDRSIAVIAADVFFEYISKLTGQSAPVIALGIDVRPTGPALADAMIHALIKKGAIIQYSAVTSAPEIIPIMRYQSSLPIAFQIISTNTSTAEKISMKNPGPSFTSRL